MNQNRMLRQVASFALCAALTLNVFGALVPEAQAADEGAVIYTFGNPNGPWRDLAKEHEEEVKQREKERKKAEKARKKAEKAAKKKAAKDAREREKREKAAKGNAEKGTDAP